MAAPTNPPAAPSVPSAPPAAPPPPAAPAPVRPAAPRRPIPWRRIGQILLPLVAVTVVVTAWAGVAVPRLRGREWDIIKTAIFSIPFVAALVLVLIFYRALRTYDRIRQKWVKSNPDDPTCKHILIVYDLSKKALYIPTITTSLVMSALMLLKDQWAPLARVDPKVLGGIWLAVFFLNFLVEEYEVDLRSLIIAAGVLAATFMWMAVMGWMKEFFEFFRQFGIQIDSTGYLLFAAIYIVAILYSMLKGSFQYVEITPNYMNIQTGLAETGEQLSREQFSTRIEAEDLIERLIGFARLVVTFSDTRRQPMVFLIHNVAKKSAQLEAIRGTYLVDQQDPTHGT